MKKKYVLGSVFITLLMLVTAIGTINTIADPSMHTGDADAGSMSISKLDVSSVVTEFDDIAIAHTIAADDWVCWEEGTGNITVDWEVDIDSTDHPEYFLQYTLSVYNIDDDGEEIGSDIFSKSYIADRAYDESGTLIADIEFDEGFMQEYDEATLFCHLDAFVQLNSSEEAINFTTWAQDRSIVGVSFDSESGEEPFSRFINEANDDWPPMWSWIGGWNESSRFDDEDDMLNTQTFCKVGSESTYPSGSSGTWDISEFQVSRSSGLVWSSNLFGVDTEYTIDPDNGDLQEDVKFDLKIMTTGKPPVLVLARYVLFHEGTGDLFDRLANRFGNLFVWTAISQSNPWPLKDIIEAHVDDDLNSDDKVDITGKIWAAGRGGYTRIRLAPYDLKIEIGNGQGAYSASSEESTYYWESSCAYENGTYDTEVDSSTSLGITTVDVDITEALESTTETEFVYTFRGDRGDTRINIKV